MASVQKQFEEFDNNIRLGTYDENKTLREKRDRVLDKLKTGIETQRESGSNIPSYKHFNQGSYAMFTGVKPTDGDYDIDVGIEFDLSASDYDPVAVKKWVFNALDGHTKKVEVRQPCVTVFYQQEGEDAYHVDLAIYGNGISPDSRELARGKLNSAEENRRWEAADALGLIEAVGSRFDGAGRTQFRRSIRALKKWKSEKFSQDGNGSPPGIGLTLAGYHWFSPTTRVDPVSNQQKDDDLGALKGLVNAMLARFGNRLAVTLPVVPRSDVFSKMTDAQMSTFKQKLEALRDALADADADPDPHTAAKALRGQFGDCFPVPEKKATAKPKGPAIVSSGKSA